MHSPSKIRHIDAVGFLYRLLSQYVDRHDLGWVGSEKGLVCLTRNDYEPDIVLYRQEKAALLQPDQMKLPAPDMVVEVLSPSTADRDRGIKLEDYAAHGVREYWIIDPVAEAVEQYVRVEPYRPDTPGTFQQLTLKTGDLLITSVVVPGFQVPVRALFDRQANLAALAALA